MMISWLVDPHRRLNEAGVAAYFWPSSALTDAEVPGRLLVWRHDRVASQEQQGVARLA
jgi:hypothetical protein